MDASSTLIDLSNEYQYVDGMIITDGLTAINATGGFAVDISLTEIELLGVNPLREFDLTETLQIDYDVRIFNEKIGLIKDASNTVILDTSFNADTEVFPIDSFTITFEDFKTNVTAERITSLGKFETLYSDFKQYINHYFYYNNEFLSLLKGEDATDISNGIFDADKFVELINGQYMNADNETVPNFSGSIVLQQLNPVLSYILEEDPFNNRTGVADLSYSVSDGFIAGDLVLVNPGLSVVLELIVDQQPFITDACYNLFTLSTTTEAPILLRLDNLS